MLKERTTFKKAVLFALISFFVFFLENTSRAEEIVAVLSSESPYYREALSGFQEAMGRPVSVMLIKGDEYPVIPKESKIVVAIGGKAARQSYPKSMAILRCLTPGFASPAAEGQGIRAQISILPSAELLLAEIKRVQPSLRSLAVLWTSTSMGAYIEQIEKSSLALGLTVLSKKIESPDQLPGHLRSLSGKMGGLWLAPDPSLVNERNFATIRDFAWANQTPFYAPTAGLAEEGAAVAIAVSFKEVGRTAAGATKKILAGETPERLIYPTKVDISVNLSAAKKCKLDVPQGILEKAAKVIP
ncbi:MAG: hypothetical protein HY747_10590 [Elusimicrobia bacterium]|nr:hypothetical protein [Elusimicrobiota bacterium]